MRLALFLFMIVMCMNLTAQDQPKMGETIDKGIYRFPVFMEGSIVFRNGSTTKVKLNYNITMDEMHFISPQGDTMAVADPLLLIISI